MGRRLLVLLVLLALPAPAHADSIVFRRGSDIWQMAPDGTAQRQLTSAGRYEWPSAADDGTLVIADTSGRLHRIAPSGAELNVIPTATDVATEEEETETPTHVRISPDGTKIAYDQAVAGEVTTLWTPADATAATFPNQFFGQEGLVAPSWIGNAQLLLSRDVSALEDGPAFAVYTVGEEDNSALPWFSDPGAAWATGFDAAASRAGDRLAVIANDAANEEGSPSRVSLRLYVGTTFRCEIPLETADTFTSASPSFSPEGGRVAWAESDGVHVATLGALDDCGAIRERVVTLPGAWEPYWTPAGLPAPAAGAPARAKLTLAVRTRARPHRTTVRRRGVGARVTVSAPTAVRVTVRAGKRVLGRVTRPVANAGTVTVRVPVKRLAKRLVVRVSAPGATSVSAIVRPRSVSRSKQRRPATAVAAGVRTP